MSLSSFWDHAADTLGDNLRLLGTAVEDVGANLNPLGSHFLSGDAPNTAAEAERQNAAIEGRDVSQARIDASSAGGLATIGQAVDMTGSQVVTAAENTASAAISTVGHGLELATNPWVIGGAVLLVVLIVGAPYIAPIAKRVL